MSRETLRKWLIRAKLWQARPARYGDLLQCAARSCTCSMSDDATSPRWFGGPALTIEATAGGSLRVGEEVFLFD
jgi:hypothetical protein